MKWCSMMDYMRVYLALMEVNLNILKNKIQELFQTDFSKTN